MMRRSALVSGGKRLAETCRLAPFFAALAAISLAAAAPIEARVDGLQSARSSTGYFSLQQIDGKWSFVGPHGHPFYSIGVAAVTMKGYIDPSGVNLYRDAVARKYGTEDAWAAAQRRRFQEWGINTVGAFSNLGPFLNRRIALTVFIRTADDDTDFWDPAWAAHAAATITRVARRYRDDRNVLGYFIDNELPWTFALHDLGRPGRELFIMGRYFHYPAGRPVLLQFLRKRYRSLDDLGADFPGATLRGADWSTLDWSTTTLGAKVTPRGEATLDAWAGVMARRYFAVTAGALRAADPHHLNLGLKFIGGLTPISVLKAEVPYVDVVSVDFYDTGALSDRRKKPSQKRRARNFPQTAAQEFESLILPLIRHDRIVPTSDMLAAWYDLTGKPVLIAEFGYRAADSGLPNTIPPGIPVLPDQKARARAVTNYADCAIDAPYIIGLQYFQLFDEPAAGRTLDGENSNWGLVSGRDVPYSPVTSALAAAGRLASRRLSRDFRPAPCTPVGIQDFSEISRQ